MHIAGTYAPSHDTESSGQPGLPKEQSRMEET
jgi:hypothetical protein